MKLTIDSVGVWYHGSNARFDVLREGSTVTQWRELAEAFSHKPSMLCTEDDGSILVLNRQAVQVFQREQRVHQAEIAVDVRHPQRQRRYVQRVRQGFRQLSLRSSRAGFVLRHADVCGLFGEANQRPQVLLRHPP